LPATNRTGDPTKFPILLPFSWYWPVGAEWGGYRMQIALDPGFTTVVNDYTLNSNNLYRAASIRTFASDLADNTYYWRIRPQYQGSIGGSWSEISRLDRKGFIPEGLKIIPEEVEYKRSFATPTFKWNFIEGAEAYIIQVSSNPGFSSTIVNVTTGNTTYTPTDTFSNGTYYWRVRARRVGNIQGEWSPSQTFTLSLPTPTPSSMTPNDPAKANIFSKNPTICWNHVLEHDNGVPVLAAWKYRVQVSRTSTFSTIYDNIDTEQNCWTPTKGYDDGTYYWRVAMIDGQGKLGEYTPPAQFYKQYPITTKVRPAHGSPITGIPEFVWTPVHGAASYRLEVSLNASFSPTFDAITTVNTRFTSTKAYDPSKPYFWRVAIIDRDGRQGPFTDIALLPTGKLFLPMIIR
jgi:hypothetical protein